MTLEEKAICEVYTGICFTSPDERGEVYKYAEKLMGRPVWTHEFPALADTLQEKARDDFIRVCKGEFASNWISIKKRRPAPEKSVLMQFQFNMAVGYLSYIDEDYAVWFAFSENGYLTAVYDEPLYWMPIPEQKKGTINV